MNRIEILSPCGSMDSVISAVRNGADAVYLGAKEFSARASAENFDQQSLKEAVEYCHIRGVLVYLTLNTLVFDDELEKAKQLIIRSAKAGIDALIVQNIGIAQMAHKIVPELALHGSTQMTVHSLCGAKLLYEMGFKRVVLAREMTRQEIKVIADNCPIELEIFVHGALCMCMSGQCYLSAMIGSRSGNRGRCAQPCRLPFTVDNKEGYALSLKDNSLINYIKDLENIGVTSAKIEGRMKRPEYVAIATRACYEQREYGTVSEETKLNLEKVFSRTGFTDGYYKSKRGYEMFGYRRKTDVVSATESLFTKIRMSYKDETKRVKLTGKIFGRIGEVGIFSVSDGKNNITVNGDLLWEKAENKPLDEEKCKKQLCKTGGTPYEFISLETNLEENVTVHFSELNNIRRKALEQLNNLRKNARNYAINDYDLPKFQPHNSSKKLNYVRTTSANLGVGFKKFDLIFVPLFSKIDDIKSLIENGYKVALEVPRALFSRENLVIETLEKAKEIGITDVLCNNLTAVYISKKLGLKIHGGFGLNFVNTLDLMWAESYGFVDTELSFELKISQIEKLGGSLLRGIISYGYLPLMLTRNCPNKSKNTSCKVCKGQGKMTDRLGKTFKFYCDSYATEVLNTAVLDVTDKIKNSSSIDFQVYRLTVENSVDKVEKFQNFINENLKKSAKTNGLYYRGII